MGRRGIVSQLAAARMFVRSSSARRLRLGPERDMPQS